jgi:hypothetical protein
MFKTIRIALLLAFSMVAVLCLSPPSIYGDDWDKATKITVNHPFEIPGMILPAGTYVFKIVNLQAERHAVRIFNEDESAIYATLLAFPDLRMEISDDTVVTFYEAEKARVPALHQWFYPGHLGGVEFAYPEKPPMEFAAVTEAPPVVTKLPEPAPIYREKPTPEPAVEEAVPEPTFEVEPETEAVTPVAEPEHTSAAEPEAVPLPKTATPFELIGLVGLLSAVAASGLGLIRK